MSFVLPTRVRLPKALEASRSRVPAGVRRFLGDGLLAAPGRLARDTPWAIRDADVTPAGTDERLGLDGYDWLFVLGVNNSATTRLAGVARTKAELERTRAFLGSRPPSTRRRSGGRSRRPPWTGARGRSAIRMPRPWTGSPHPTSRPSPGSRAR